MPIELPDWQTIAAQPAEYELNPLEQFVYVYEPGRENDVLEWREGLRKTIEWLVSHTHENQKGMYK